MQTNKVIIVYANQYAMTEGRSWIYRSELIHLISCMMCSCLCSLMGSCKKHGNLLLNPCRNHINCLKFSKPYFLGLSLELKGILQNGLFFEKKKWKGATEHHFVSGNGRKGWGYGLCLCFRLALSFQAFSKVCPVILKSTNCLYAGFPFSAIQVSAKHP